ncbi:MAG: 3D domain-containing protein [Verrucomicrobia bacterium]|nr:3D domain-containing protein [Verrucomicrobiota bacterium]
MGVGSWKLGTALLLLSAICHLPSPALAASTRWVRVTAYCPCRICCGPNACGLTATGRQAVGQIVAVDPRRIPLGSMVHVNGRWNRADDTGRDIKGANRLDLLFATHEEAKRFGWRWMPVTILTRREWQRKLDDERFERRMAEIIAAGQRLAAGTYRRADGGLELAR